MKKRKTDIKITTLTSLTPLTPRYISSLNKPTTNHPATISKLKSRVYTRLIKKHNNDISVYNTKVIDNLIYNKNTHLSVQFRDAVMLQFNDEFLKRYIFLIYNLDIIK